MIVRELLAIFGLDYDGKGQREAERGIAGLTSQVGQLQSAFIAALTATAIAAPFVALTKMASDAQENLNLLQLSFGENADEIVAWSEEVAPAIGRSKFTLRELAAEFGGLLQPMIGTGEQLAEMSKGLTQLAVDLSSARNVPENEALRALQSGLSGNIIAMKRFGVNLSQVRVQNEAMKRGLGKSTKALSQGQLAAIRYDLIMKDLAFIQGDAAATLDQFANSSRAARDALKDIGTELGFFFLPAAEGALSTVRDMLKPVAQAAENFRKWAADTNLAKGAMVGLVVIIGALMLPILMKIVPLLLAFALFAVIMDDVITTFEGGNSVIGEFTKWLDTMEGEGFPDTSAAAEVLMWTMNRLRDAIGFVGLALLGLYEGFALGEWQLFDGVIAITLQHLTDLGQAVIDIGWGIKHFTKEALTPLIEKLSEIGPTAIGQAMLNMLPGGGGGGEVAGGGTMSAPAGRGGGAPVSVTQGDKHYNIAITQQPGQSSEDLASWLGTELDKREESKDQAFYRDLVQTPAGGF